jgi:hypothetical protein
MSPPAKASGAFAELDCLYSQILSSSADIALTLCVLSAWMVLPSTLSCRCGSASCSVHDAFVILTLDRSFIFLFIFLFIVHPEHVTKDSRVGAEYYLVRTLNFEIAGGCASSQKE